MTPHASRAGSVGETAATASQSPPSFRKGRSPCLSEELDDSLTIDISKEMEEEKSQYPGAGNWAPDEERLFEILYLRQDLPMLPSTWDCDFRGVPMPEAMFQTSEEFAPIIYAHSKEFQATFALLRLIDLTAKVRTILQAGRRNKVPGIIKREIDRYLSWAAQDGDYAHLRIIPNIITEVIDTTISQDKITEYIENKMRALGRLQRQFLQGNKNPMFWEVVKPSIMTSFSDIKVESEDDSPDPKKWPGATPKEFNLESNSDNLSIETPTRKRTENLDMAMDSKKYRLFLSRTSDGIDELASFEFAEGSTDLSPVLKLEQTEEDTASTSAPPFPGVLFPRTPEPISYRHQPPVVYGLFILNTSVLLLTIDSSQGDDAYVTFHIQTDFQDRQQSVWNALTIAIAACRARDELMTRVSDFGELSVIEESDPDA
ncbi:hypothetical protein BGZ63DRAFT_353390 [Mariannaea sp. PMI_226]|nr:hypothetical protein BGZ63DRAFT_353390 [Mariannaea sp. PMI_226]